ncbi:MAG: arylamine N-acetyltransferase [Gemmatimonadota bacterium]|nr:MAG: arylamine N-acetyltransferase [Gemmatimonadota bacterium]
MDTIESFHGDPKIILDPQRHTDGVRAFMDYFGLPHKEPGLRFLEEILVQFSKIPYENISKIIKLNNLWDAETKIRFPEEIIDDHISYRLGGTCFSLTFFLQTILTLNGLCCYPVMADMRAGRNIHCCVVAMLGNSKYLIDPGYLLHKPMEIHSEKPRFYRTEFHGIELRFDSDTQYYNLFTFDEKETKWRYRFQDMPTPPEEFLKHWYASFWKPTLHGILLTKVTQEGLIYVHKTFMRETTFQGKRNINIKKNYHAVINDVFGIDPRVLEQGQAALEENLTKERAIGLFPKKVGGLRNETQ